MQPDCDYAEYLADPDKPLEWDHIAQLVLSTSKDESSCSCPICLSDPVAPMVAKCGHTFCWTCLLKYLSFGEKAWRKCPICYDPIYPNGLKPVRFFHTAKMTTATIENPTIIELTLMKRKCSSTIALPQESYAAWGAPKKAPSVNLTEAVRFARIIECGQSYLDSILHEQRDDLERSEKELLDSSHGPTAKTAYLYEKQFYERCQKSLRDSMTLDRLKNCSVTIPPGEVDEKTFSFYQAADGQNIYIHPLDSKILKYEYGSYDAFPSLLFATVIGVQDTSIDAVLVI